MRRPKTGAKGENKNPDIKLSAVQDAALEHILEKVRVGCGLEAEGYQMETASFIYVPPCTPAQSFHQDHDPEEDPSGEMGTVLHLQEKSKST